MLRLKKELAQNVLKHKHRNSLKGGEDNRRKELNFEGRIRLKNDFWCHETRFFQKGGSNYVKERKRIYID